MSRIKLETSFSPIVNISQIQGSLRIKGWDRPEFRGDADLNDTLYVKQKEDSFDIKCSSGCMLRIPVESTIKIGKVERELLVKSIEGDIEIDEVNQQIILKNVSKTTIETANSNLNAKQIEGDLSIKTLNGNAVIRDVDGNLEIHDSNGSLNIRGLAHGLTANAKGNAILRFEPEPEGKYEINAIGSINCKVSPGAGGEVIIISSSNTIRVRVPELSEDLNIGEYHFEFGEGTSKITLNAGGSVSFTTYRPDDDFGDEFEVAFEEDFSNLADEITQQVTDQIESQMDALSAHLNEITASLSIGMTSSERSRRKLESQRRLLERKLSRAQEKVDRKIHAMEARKRAYQHRYQGGRPSDPVSEEERKMILEMLQAQQISVEEAETLLEALEGETLVAGYSDSAPTPVPPEPMEASIKSQSQPEEKPTAALKAQATKKAVKSKTTTKKKASAKIEKSKQQKKSDASETKSEGKTTGTKK
jgi:hypothetical protein